MHSTSRILAVVSTTLLLVTLATAQQQPIQRVQTALNHLTVIEAGEPITMVAAGSDAFEIERHGNRIFLKPDKAGVSTNLFVWTEHGHSIYELAPAGEVQQMDVLIRSGMRYDVMASSARTSAEGSKEIADKVLTEMLLNAAPVKAVNLKTRKNRVNVKLDSVVHDQEEIYVRYKVTNRTSVPYRLGAPAVALVRGTETPDTAIAANTQVGEGYLSHLGTVTSAHVPVLRSDITEKDISPGRTVSGVLAIPQAAGGSHLYSFSFGADAKAPVIAAGML